MVRPLLPALLILSLLPLAGCFGGDGGFGFEPGTDYRETGRTVHLKATVVDLDRHEVFPGPDGARGYGANLWAFCFEPFDPSDTYSADAIEPFTPLPGDGSAAVETDGRCGVPGPTIRVTQGDRVIVEFSHSHFHPHTIHWHGQFVPWESDGAPGVSQDAVEPGQSITYDFIAKRAGTLWYHCHVDTQLHVMQGLYGMFIVEPQDTSHEPKDIDREYAWVLSTLNAAWVWEGNPKHRHPAGCFTSGTPDCTNPPVDTTPDVFMVNGHSYPYTMEQEETTLRIADGERVRLRILNAGESFETLHPHGHDMRVTHRDGSPLEAPYWVDTLTIGPGERYDVVIEGNNPGAWMIHTHVSGHETNCGAAPGGMHAMLLYDGYDGHGFSAELPAACTYTRYHPAIPDDLFTSRTFRLGTAAEIPTTRAEVPVGMACAVREVTLTARIETPSPSMDALSEVAIAIVAPNGDILDEFTLGGLEGSSARPTEGTFVLSPDRRVGGSLDPFPLTDGNFTVEAGGRAVEATLVVEGVVDYYGSFDETRQAHLLYGFSACPGYA